MNPHDAPEPPQAEIDDPSISKPSRATVPPAEDARTPPGWVPSAIGIVLLVGLGLLGNALVRSRTGALRAADGVGNAVSRVLPVQVTELVPVESIRVPRTFTGTVVARRSTQLAFEGSGRVAEIRVDDGDEVRSGELLATLDTESLRAERRRVEASRERVAAGLAELEAGPRAEVIDAARAELAAVERDLELARLQRDRRTELVARGTVPEEQLDTLISRAETLESGQLAAAARLAELENGTRDETLAAQRAALAEVDAGLHAIDVQIEKAKLVAPFDGRVAARYVDEGAVVSQQMPAAAFEIVESKVLEARIGVPVALAEELCADNGIETVVVRGHRIGVLSARSLPTLDRGTRTATLVLDLAPADVGSSRVRPGDVVRLTHEVTRRESGAWVPLAALRESTRGLWSAMAVVPSESEELGFITERLELEVLRANGDQAFVRGTFAGPLRIVATGGHRVVPGQRVEPLPAESPSTSVDH